MQLHVSRIEQALYLSVIVLSVSCSGPEQASGDACNPNPCTVPYQTKCTADGSGGYTLALPVSGLKNRVHLNGRSTQSCRAGTNQV